MNQLELATLRDSVRGAQLVPKERVLSPKEEAGRQALAALHEAERRWREKGGAPKPPRLKLRCTYCGEPVRLNEVSKKKNAPATCRLHRDLPGLDPYYTS